MRRSDADLALLLHQVAVELDHPRPLPEAILRVLAGGPCSGHTLARVLQRRRVVVMACCRDLARDGRIVRDRSKWRLQ